MEQQARSGWQTVTLGEDMPNVPARLACGLGDDNVMSAFLKFRDPRDGKVYMVRMCIDVAKIEKELTSQMAQSMVQTAVQNGEQPTGAVAGGRFLRRLKKFKRKIKHFAKKVAHSKLVRGIVKVAKKVINNPLVKMALAVVPGGQAVLATQVAARVAARAIKGHHHSKRALAIAQKGVAANDPGSINVARLVKAGVRGSIPINLHGAVAGCNGSERQYLHTVLGECLQGGSNPTVSAGADNYLMVSGADEQHELQDIDALREFATSGAWEGARWLAQRLGLHSMISNPSEFSRRDALTSGHAAQIAFYNRAHA